MPKAQVVITLHDDGRFDVKGPLDNKILMYGLLGLAHEAVLKRANEPAGLVQPVSIAIPPIKP